MEISIVTFLYFATLSGLSFHLKTPWELLALLLFSFLIVILNSRLSRELCTRSIKRPYIRWVLGGLYLILMGSFFSGFLFIVVFGWIAPVVGFTDLFARFLLLTLAFLAYLIISRSRPIAIERESPVATNTKAPQNFMVKVGKKLIVVKPEEVAYFYSDGNLTRLVMRNGTSCPVDQPLRTIESNMGSAFFRVNRKFLLSRGSVLKMVSHSRARTKVDLVPEIDLEVIVTTHKNQKFKTWMMDE